MTTDASSAPLGTADLLAAADALAESGHALEALEQLHARTIGRDDPAVEIRLTELRYRAFAELHETGFEHWPVAIDGVDRTPPGRVPEITPADLTADTVRRHVLSHGSVLVRGLFAPYAQGFVDGIDLAVEARDAGRARDERDPWFHTLRLPPAEAKSLGRYWVSGVGGVLACDSPRLLAKLFDSYTQIGLRDLLADYLGERPVLSANKCTFKRVPLDSNTDWHQDGAFLGAGIRSLNVWVALSECGIDSPGLDILPKRFDTVVETGTGGAFFDWAVGSDTVRRIAPDVAPVRPHFQAGDVLLFDDLFLHRTGVSSTMTRPRYAIESWFFAPSSYPTGQVPLVW